LPGASSAQLHLRSDPFWLATEWDRNAQSEAGFCCIKHIASLPSRRRFCPWGSPKRGLRLPMFPLFPPDAPMRCCISASFPISGTLAGSYRRFDRSREKPDFFFHCVSQIGNAPVGSLLRSVRLSARSRSSWQPPCFTSSCCCFHVSQCDLSTCSAIDDPLQRRPCSAFPAKKSPKPSKVNSISS